MACEFRVVPVHVHGHQADIDAFFERLEQAFDSVLEDMPLLWPSLEIVEDEEGDE